MVHYENEMDTESIKEENERIWNDFTELERLIGNAKEVLIQRIDVFEYTGELADALCDIAQYMPPAQRYVLKECAISMRGLFKELKATLDNL